MGGQGRCKHAKETGGRMLLDEYNKWNLRAKKDMFVFLLVVETVVVCLEIKACRNL
jgi:hypothetical protein